MNNYNELYWYYESLGYKLCQRKVLNKETLSYMIDVLDSFPITILGDNHVVLWYEGEMICSIYALI